MSKSSFCAISVGFVVICFFPAASNEQHVADLDVTALSRGANIDALVFAALVQLLPGDGVVVIGVVVDAFLVGVAAVVEENAASSDAVLGPVMD